MMKAFPFLMISALAILLFSCQEEEPEAKEECGWLHLDLDAQLRVHELNSALKSTQGAEDFRVVIFHIDGNEALAYERADLMPEWVELEAGDYYVEAYSDNDLPAAFENPYYFGSSEIFTISSNTQDSVLVNCSLANTMVSVSYAPDMNQVFSHYSTTVSSAQGSLVYAEDESRMGYFRTLPLQIAVDLSWLKADGSMGEKSLVGSIPDPLPNRHYEIQVDASVDEGMLAFHIFQDSSEVQVEIIPISDRDTLGSGGPISYGDLLITEIMYDPSALSDTQGEWLELFNNTSDSIPLRNLILIRDQDYMHTISEDLMLPPGAYIVLERNDTASAAALSYTYGSSITLSNTGAELVLHNADEGNGPGAPIFSLNYGDADFPSGSGASICLDPAITNPAEASLGANWCTSLSVFYTGDLGTPGGVNDPCQ